MSVNADKVRAVERLSLDLLETCEEGEPDLDPREQRACARAAWRLLSVSILTEQTEENRPGGST